MTEVVLPKVALTMTEGVIVEWLVEEGTAVRKGEPLFTMETDKTEVAIESPGDGVLQGVRYRAGDTVPAGEVVATLADADADAAAGEGAGDAADAARAVDAPAPRGVAPAAAALAGQLGIDLTTVVGTGTGGRVVESDVIKVASSAPPAAVAPEPTARAAEAVETEPVEASRARRAGLRLTELSVAVPTFFLAGPVDVAPVRDAMRAAGVGVTDVVAVAAAGALRDVPLANACIREGEVRHYRSIRVAILVRSGDALVPLVFDDPAAEGAVAFHARRRAAQDVLGNGVLPVSQTAGATFAISNLGAYGVDAFTAVLFPQTAITLALGATGADPTRPGTARATLTCDHRIVDGVDAAAFLAALQRHVLDLDHARTATPRPGTPMQGAPS